MLPTFQLKKLIDSQHYDAACRVFNSMQEITTPDREQEQYIYILGLLIKDYEEAYQLNGHALLADLFAKSGMTQAEFSAMVGMPVSGINSYLTKKRHISRGGRKALAAHFHLDEARFLT